MHGNKSFRAHPREEYWFEEQGENRHNLVYKGFWQSDFKMSRTAFEFTVKRRLKKADTQFFEINTYPKENNSNFMETGK